MLNLGLSVLGNPFLVNCLMFTDDLSIIRYLLEQHYTTADKCSVREPVTGNTLLHLAVMASCTQPLRLEAINLALKHGVDPTTKNRCSLTPSECFEVQDTLAKSRLQTAMEEKKRSSKWNFYW